jgi:nucleotide-binding universal stress UspA family protein
MQQNAFHGRRNVMLTTVLLATTLQPGQQYSAPALAARDVVLALANGHTTRLHVLSVYDYATIQTHGLPADVAATYRDAQMQRLDVCLKRQLDAYITPFIASGMQVAKLLRVGKPRDVIVHAAAELKADLLLIGMPSKRGRCDITLGRTTRYIRQHAPCPVLLVSPRCDRSPG